MSFQIFCARESDPVRSCARSCEDRKALNDGSIANRYPSILDVSQRKRSVSRVDWPGPAKNPLAQTTIRLRGHELLIDRE